MKMAEIHLKRKMLRKGSRHFDEKFVEIPKEFWPKDDPNRSFESPNSERIRVLRNRDFLVQVFTEGQHEVQHTRISVNRIEILNNGDWKDGITWDELEHIKNEIGYSNQHAVELYPPKDQIVNVANMRHLWLLNEYPAYAWIKRD